MKTVYITEKPSQAMDYVKALHLKGERKDGYYDAGDIIVTWCVGHLVAMSYPEAYDEELKKWTLETLPFVPSEFKYEIISDVKKQFNVVKKILTDSKVETIYFAGDSGREGQYIEALVILMCGDKIKTKNMKRIWIDSTTEDEIKRGIRTARPMSAYDNLSAAGFLRAKEDYLMGINFSRVLTIQYGDILAQALGVPHFTIAVGRVMSCVLAMIVNRENEIVNFVEKPFFGIEGIVPSGMESVGLALEWKAVEGSAYHNSPLLFKDTGFSNKADAEKLMNSLSDTGTVAKLEQKKEQKFAPLLYNLAEIQSECSRKLKISPDQTLDIVQTLYEAKMVTYPRTDARVLSTAVAAEITKHISGLKEISEVGKYAEQALAVSGRIASSRYVNDEKITDHYAIIPTGQATGNLDKLSDMEQAVYMMIVKRFLAIFMPPAEYDKTFLEVINGQEHFFYNEKNLSSEGFLQLYRDELKKENVFKINPADFPTGKQILFTDFKIKEGKTTPPKRYTSGSIILAMENAGQTIDDEELRMQIKGCGIGTSATRANIISKLVKIQYISLNSKTQILMPTIAGSYVCKILGDTIPTILNPKHTASWEKGLSQVEQGIITQDAYMKTLSDYIKTVTNKIKGVHDQDTYRNLFGVKKVDTFPCPCCGESLEQKNWGYVCRCGFKVGFTICEKKLSTKEMTALLTKKETGVIKGFRKKDGTTFDAALKIENKDVKFVFNTLKCPCCGKDVRKSNKNNSYYCTGIFDKSCSFGFFETMYGKKLTAKHISDLLNKGKTGLIKGFKNKDGSDFEGYLIIEGDKVRVKGVKK